MPDNQKFSSASYSKTEVFIIGLERFHHGSITVFMSADISDLFLMFHCQQEFLSHRLIVQIKPFLSFGDFYTSAHFHYFMSWLRSLCRRQSFLVCLQLDQNTAVRLLISTRRRGRIFLILTSLHWLSVKYRVCYIFLSHCMVWLQLTIPHPMFYIQILLLLLDQLLLSVTCLWSKRKGDRAFSIATFGL